MYVRVGVYAYTCVLIELHRTPLYGPLHLHPSASGTGAPYVTSSPEVNRRRLIQVQDCDAINFDEPLVANDDITSATEQMIMDAAIG